MAGVIDGPLVAASQQAGAYRIGFLHPSSPSATADATYARVFRAAVRALGYVEGENVIIDFRWAEGDPERLPALAADLVRREVAVMRGIE